MQVVPLIMKKTLVLVILFVFPVVAYLFFASGVNNFGRLPVLTEGVSDIGSLDAGQTLKGKISILGFLGRDVGMKKGNAFNLNQKIYKHFYEFNDFQIVMVLPDGTQEPAAGLKKELGNLVDVGNWKFVFGTDRQVQELFDSLGTNLQLDGSLATPYVFIVDKDLSLRGRRKDEDEGVKFGFDTSSVADLNNKMVDDVKIILAEYRLALKKNNADRE